MELTNLNVSLLVMVGVTVGAFIGEAIAKAHCMPPF